MLFQPPRTLQINSEVQPPISFRSPSREAGTCISSHETVQQYLEFEAKTLNCTIVNGDLPPRISNSSARSHFPSEIRPNPMTGKLQIVQNMNVSIESTTLSGMECICMVV